MQSDTSASRLGWLYMSSQRECRVYGNQHGRWIEFTGDLADDIETCCKVLGITPKEFLDRAIKNYLAKEERP